jgi:hypothetical protein
MHWVLGVFLSTQSPRFSSVLQIPLRFLHNAPGGSMMKVLKPKVKIERPERERVSREEALKRVKAFAKRKEKLIAAIRKGTH